ncbi:MAG: hypothetical protein KME25_04775 [Symplocastrum torsivum CPER-KK1]|uniref:Uncharacterized protein n=1 Tax=Symplocastrum torsivum CPER-KK1 TaxID=450513 RepID=A0A951U8H3_9CYAN|nr:hypothetical protein [Symplocastrum torsivum CPER-KK1]
MIHLPFCVAKRTNKGYRVGQVRNRSQLENHKTGQPIKPDTRTGRFMDASDKPFKGVRKEE